MEPTMNAALDGISKSGIRVFTQMAKQEPGCLFLTLGEPDFDTPASIREATHRVMNACCQYPNFVISSGCDIPPLSQWDNIDAFFAAVKEFYQA